MGENTVSFKCPNCSAALSFGSDSGKFECEYCGGLFDLEEVKNAEVNDDGKGFDWGDFKKNIKTEILDGTVTYSCKSCGAEIVADATTAATSCPYCGNPVVMNEKISGFIRPNGIIPFKVNKAALSEILKGFCKGKLLLPKNFLSENVIEEIKGIYVPFWLFDCHADGDMTFEGTRIRRWSDSRYNYTETSHYLVYCDGEMSFSRIPVDGSKKADDNLMDSLEPYDYSQIVGFEPGYLAGYLADRFDCDADSSLPRAESRVKNSMEQTFRSGIIGFATLMKLSSNIKLDRTDVKYTLLPAYIITSKYKDKTYRYAVNGQTGKIVGTLPVSRTRFFAFLAGFTAIIGAIAYAISCLA